MNSCRENTIKQNFVDGKQVPIINSQLSKINITGLDIIFKDQQFCAHIVQTETDLNIIEAYIGSHPDNNCFFSKSLVDTALKSLDNCSIELKTEGDTAYFCLTPTTSKKYSFKVAVLSIDQNSNYYLDTLNLSFDAKEKTNP